MCYLHALKKFNYGEMIKNNKYLHSISLIFQYDLFGFPSNRPFTNNLNFSLVDASNLTCSAWSLLTRTRYGRLISFSAVLTVSVLSNLLASSITMLPPVASIRASTIIPK